MSKIFRYCIKGAEIVTVEDELNIIQEYMSIIDIRFMGRHTAQYEIDPDALKQPLIKMSLQPIIENAVYHGLEASDKDGHLMVRCVVDEEYLHFSIEDDGVGIEQEFLHELNESLRISDQNYFSQSKRSIGLNNINMRCRLYYGERFRFHIESGVNRGTKVTMDIPLNR
jgi:two-component system sensor histidine kinase YesM